YSSIVHYTVHPEIYTLSLHDALPISIIERFSNFPINVEVLSRFKSPKEQKSIVERLGKGLVDLVVGTHRLLSKDVKFKDLGLLIDRKSTRLNSSHVKISYAVFCLKKK